MDFNAVSTILLWMLMFPVLVSWGAEVGLPLGAAKLNYSNKIIDERPTSHDIAEGNKGSYKWFSGQWYNNYPPSLNHYTTMNGVLAISLHGDIVSTARDFSSGLIPLLAGSKGFYVEFDIQLSDNDPDHFPAVWLMPIEHNLKKDDHYMGDPPEFERWMELDVDEGGFAPGVTGTVHSWEGIYPQYSGLQNKNHRSHFAINRAEKHSFGASYDPKNNQVIWYLDDRMLHSASSPFVPEIAKKQNFYLIISAQSHGMNKPYTMYVSRVRAYIPNERQ